LKGQFGRLLKNYKNNPNEATHGRDQDPQGIGTSLTTIHGNVWIIFLSLFD